MNLFEPDDFADDPYQAGLNQMGHAVFGAALISITMAFTGVWLATFCVGTAILIWEVTQRWFRGATLPDYAADLIYWALGVGLWGQAIHHGSVIGWAQFFPVAMIGIWCVEYARIVRRWL